MLARCLSAAPVRVAALAALAVALGIGCKPKIGDGCAVSTDCSVNGDRLCDTTQPGGYCTVFNCEPGTCPADQSVCVAFHDQVCADPRSSERFERTFCMRTCDDDSDCRGGQYACLDEGTRV